MRLRLAVFGGVAVILALTAAAQQAGGVRSPRRMPAQLQRARPGPEQDAPPRPDMAAALFPQDTAAAQPRADVAEADSVVRLRLGLKLVPLPFPIDLALTLPDPGPRWDELWPRVTPAGDVWAAELARRAADWRAGLWRESRPVLPAPVVAEPLAAAAAGAPTGVPAAPEPAADSLAAEAVAQEGGRGQLLPDVFGRYADLGMAVQGRVEMGGGWNRYRPCNVNLQVDCSPSLIPNIKPDLQFGARVGGTVTDRIHISLDYDNRREFDATNNINVYYRGLEDEILQRVEVGDVSFALPQSRYLTQGIPAGNFGFRATGQMGPIDFQGVWAQQKGDVGVRELQVGGSGQGYEQQAVTILDDADYESGRFFFLFSPTRIAAFPHIDVQNLVAGDAPRDLQPGSAVKVYRYEPLGFGAGSQVPEGFITAIAVAVDTVSKATGADTVVTDTLSGLFRPLVDGEDYALHRSALWLVLRNTLRPEEGLAITYVAEDGTEIGTFDAEAVSNAHNADPQNVPPPTLELLGGVNPRPGTATWRRELHNVYRVSASPGVVESSVQLIISQGNPELGNTFRTTPNDNQLEFLKIFGLDDDPTDSRLDVSRVYEITGTGGGGLSGPVGTFVILPTLEPFKTPPPLQDISDPLIGQPFPLAEGDQNRLIYDEVNDRIRRGSNLYTLTISYQQRFEGFLSTISLGVGGVRENSERLVIDDVELVRGEDYIVDYEVGQIELRDPERWFRDTPNARVRVSYEQKPLFQLAPTSVFGLQARYGLGSHGEFNFIGLSQAERTLQTRPELGLEPSKVLLGGLSGRLNFQPRWLTSLVDALPGVDAVAPSAITLDGEIALSAPNTNTQGTTYVEDFEGGTGFSVLLLSRAWKAGAATLTVAGAEDVAPPFLSEANAAEVVWQDQYLAEGGQIAGPLPPEVIDPELELQGGRGASETVLNTVVRMPGNRVLAPNPDPPAGPAWASVTSVLSLSGQDFTTIEFLEFYVAASDQAADSTTLILDLGTVSEDAFAIDSLRQLAGSGELNREVVPPRVWSNADDAGLWPTGCEAEPGEITYPLGDVSANCTRNNGIEDSEDFNQNGVLDQDERFFRYTVKLGDRSGPYFVRDAGEVGSARFRLYRIPLRRPDHRERVTDAEFQNVRHLRVTMIANFDVTLAVARMRFLGSRWLKRGETGFLVGRADTASVTTGGALLEVGPISTLDERYVPPPGVTDEAASQGDPYGLGAVQVNEQSLSVRFSELGPGERAEVYLQYTQTARDFIAYRAVRLWALGIAGDWGTGPEPLRLIVKFGENAGNTYLYQTGLHSVPPDATGEDLRQYWEPEIVVDCNRFIALRTRAEEIMLNAGGLPGDSTLTVWDVDVFSDGDSSYAVVIGQRSRAPNLAAVRQISIAVYNAGGAFPASGELWVDDIRLDDAVDNTGIVGQFNINLRGSDILDLNLSYASENAYFRQLGQTPAFSSRGSYRLGGRVQIGRMLPRSWLLSLPLGIDYSNSSSEPLLLPRTDISGTALGGLRAAESRHLRVDLSLSRQASSGDPRIGWFVDNSALRVMLDRQTSQSSRSRTEARGTSISYSFRSDVADLSIPIVPGKDWRLRLSPKNLQFGAGYVNSDAETRRFQEVITLPGDTAVVPIRTLDRRLQANASMGFEPFASLSGQFALAQTRELAPTNYLVRGEAARDAITAERRSLAGVDLGWLTAHNVTMNWTWRPSIATWFVPTASVDTRYRMSRGASYFREQAGDTVLTGDFDNSRSLRAALNFNAPVMLTSLLGESRSGFGGALLGLLDRLDIFTVAWSGAMASTYHRQTARADLAYRLGLGGFDDFVVQDGDTASRVADSQTLTFATGFRLPLGASLSVNYGDSDVLLWTPVNQTRNKSTSWPSVTLAWTRLPLPAILQRWVNSLGVRVGYNLRSSRSEVSQANQLRETDALSIPLSINLSLTTEWSFGYTLDLGDEERRDPTGVTESKRANHSLQVNGRVRALSSQGRFRNPIRVSIRLSQDRQEQCRTLGNPYERPPLPGGEPLSCEPFTDLRIRRMDLTVDTDVPPLSLGLQGTWRDTQSEIGQRPGNTQLEITLFGQFLVETGEIR